MVRDPVVAGRFYPSDFEELERMLSMFCVKREKRIRAKAIIVPHAGYVYSGAVAGLTYGSVEIPSLNVVMGPNHTGFGADVSVFDEGEWITPLGRVPVNSEVAKKLCGRELFKSDVSAHVYEHSLEVQLPFLQFCSGFKEDLSIVPIIFSMLSYEECELAGKALAESIDSEDALIVISSDFSHYVSQPEAERLDSMAINSILSLSPFELYEKVRRYNITMCGVIPATVGLIAAKILGAESADLLVYRTSGDVTGDYSQVVGYAGIVVY